MVELPFNLGFHEFSRAIISEVMKCQKMATMQKSFLLSSASMNECINNVNRLAFAHSKYDRLLII